MAELNGVAGGSPAVPDGQTNAYQMPDEFRDKSALEIAQAYDADRQSWRSREQELEPLRQMNEQLKGYGGLDALVQSYGQVWNQYQQLLQQQNQWLSAQNQPTPQQGQPMPANDQNQNLFGSDWDYLTPREQQERMYRSITDQVMQAMQQNGNALYERGYQQLQRENAGLRSEFDVYRKVQDFHQKNPNEDLPSVLQDAVNLSKSTPEEWLELAAMRRDYQSGRSAQKQAEELFEKWKAEETLRQQNEAMSASINSPGGQGFASYFPDSSSNNSMEPSAVQQRVLERVLNDSSPSGITRAHLG